MSFYEVADDISAETYELATYFCEHGGKASRVQHPKLQTGSPKAVYGGGLFHIDTIEVHPVLRGRDMGLLLIRMALKFLGSRWTLAVMMPIDAMFIYGTKWNTNAKNQAVNWEELTEKKLQLQTKENHSLKVKLLRYFGRMGFTQAQKTTNGYNKLFLTSEMYYTSSGIVKPWVKKGVALEQIKVYVPSPQPVHTAINITKARRGGNVDVADEDGNRALHLAAEKFNATEVKRLLAAGATLEAKNKEGNTALDVAVLKLRSWNDRSLTNRHQKRVPLETNVVPPYETISALTNKDVKEKMSDGWLSPRMRKMLSITAELKGDELRENILRYVPADACSDQRSKDKLFQGFEYCFKVLAHMLNYGMVPTTEKAKKMTNHFSIGRRAYEPFIDGGGRFEFVIDALIDITENVHDDGDDGWEYEHFEEEIEALVETPMDGMFDLARLMLINRGGGVLEGRGPYELSAEDYAPSYGGRGGYDDYYGDY